jgi:tripartite-type tricarboxylate transporter receptor subunit TctC
MDDFFKSCAAVRTGLHMGRRACLALGLAALSATSAWAAYPDKTITLVVPFPPGGSTDMIARLLATKMSEKLGQSVIVDNKAGATGSIGAAFVKRAAPDGYTVLVSSLGPFVIVPHLIKGAGYDPLHDFDYLTVVAQSPNVLVVPPNSPFKSVADVLAAQRAKPDTVTFASSGNGSSDHLSAVLFWQQSGTSGLHVPYKGGGPAITDLLGGNVDAAFQNVNNVIQYILAGKLKVLAVAGDKRLSQLPQTPTLSEVGVKDADVLSWQGVAAPKGLPSDVKKRLVEALAWALSDAQVRARLSAIGFEVVGNTPEQFATNQAREYAKWKQVIEARKITAD